MQHVPAKQPPAADVRGVRARCRVEHPYKGDPGSLWAAGTRPEAAVHQERRPGGCRIRGEDESPHAGAACAPRRQRRVCPSPAVGGHQRCPEREAEDGYHPPPSGSGERRGGAIPGAHYHFQPTSEFAKYPLRTDSRSAPCASRCLQHWHERQRSTKLHQIC